jgi:hypothetical protein
VTAAAAPTATLALRVTVTEIWDEIPMVLPAATTVAELKRQALAAARVRTDPAGYVVKFRGAEVLDEGRSLAAAGIVPNAALIVYPRRRRPIRI